MRVGIQSHAPGMSRYLLYGKLCEHQAGSVGCGKSLLHRDSIPRTVQTVTSRYTDWVIPVKHRPVLRKYRLFLWKEPIAGCVILSGHKAEVLWRRGCFVYIPDRRFGSHSLHLCIDVFFLVMFCSCRELPCVQTPNYRPQDSISQNQTSNCQ